MYSQAISFPSFLYENAPSEDSAKRYRIPARRHTFRASTEITTPDHRRIEQFPLNYRVSKRNLQNLNKQIIVVKVV